MRRHYRSFVALVACLAAGAAVAASFDCAKAKTRAEHAICADPEVSELDEVLERHFFGARETLKEGESCLVANQRDWLRHKRDECVDAACLKAAYLDRLSELRALQPGINTQRRLPLPERSMLAWVIAPAPEALQGPSIASKPQRVEGALVTSDDSLYALRDAQGRDLPLILDMFLDGATANMLPILVETQRGAKFLVSGYVATDSRGKPYFDNRHCVFMHRLPTDSRR